MRIDSTHRAWLAASLIILGVATAVYIAYATHSASGPRGGSAIGLTFGIIGSAFMVFAGLLGARKKVPVWRLGRAQAWMRGHLWLGLLSLPLICFHAGFRFGGVLTSVLMILLITVVVSGIFGAVLQHYMPSMVTARVPMETIFEQIDNIRDQLVAEADGIVDAMCGPASLEIPAVAGIMPVGAAAAAPALSAGTLPLRKFYSREMRPFLRNEVRRSSSLASEARARAMFEGLRTLLPESFHDTINNLEQICEEERQMRRQMKFHHWLHGWLMLHVPLSLALLLLGCAHAIMALRY
ncbi:MAG: hypothetical protein ACRD59_01215 [Candidatus Acidiferrales bacterium]